MHYFTLSIFSWSLFQFSLNLVVRKGQSFQSFQLESVDKNSMEDEESQPVAAAATATAADTEKNAKEEPATKKNLIKIKLNSKKSSCLSCLSFDNEIWSILITLLFQDGFVLEILFLVFVNFLFIITKL